MPLSSRVTPMSTVTPMLKTIPVSPDSAVPSGLANGRQSHPSVLASNWSAVRSHTLQLTKESGPGPFSGVASGRQKL